jgi:hypothetical protein
MNAFNTKRRSSSLKSNQEVLISQLKVSLNFTTKVVK